MVVVVFRSRLRDPDDSEYAERFSFLLELARSTPGFVSFRRYSSDDGERLALVEFESLEALRAWRQHPDHVEAQRLGRERFYEWYDLTICETVRAYSFDGERRSERA